MRRNGNPDTAHACGQSLVMRTGGRSWTDGSRHITAHN